MQSLTRAVRLVVVFVLAASSVVWAASGSLKVTSFPSGAQVWIDGVNTGKVTPMSVSLVEGDHAVTVQLPNSGWNPDTRTVTIVAGNNDLSVTLLPMVTQGPPGPQGQQGEPGIQGPAGTGVTVVEEPAGVNCASGGLLVSSANGNSYVCNGTGSAGSARPDPPCYKEVYYGAGRYMDCDNGTVTDAVTGLLWLKDADCSVFNQQAPWYVAQAIVANLGDGQCGLSDGSAPGDWRLPTRAEWQQTLGRDEGGEICRGPAITDGWGTGCFGQGPTPFLHVAPVPYWSTTAYLLEPSLIWRIDLNDGEFQFVSRTVALKVWPVRRH